MPEAIHTCPADADHAHGANTKCYLHHGCRCAICRASNAARARERRRQMAYGTYTRRMVDATAAREHLAHLRAQGMGVVFISAASGVSRITLASIVWGRPDKSGTYRLPKRVKLTTETAILAVQPSLDAFADHALIDGRGTRRRIQALCHRGWNLQAIARRVGTGPNRFQRLVHADRVLASAARMVVTVYDELWDEQPPRSTPAERAVATRAASVARRRHWVGPLDWDDIDTDPAPLKVARIPRVKAPVDDVAIEAALNGEQVRLTPAERRVCVPRLHARYYSDGLIADFLHCDVKTVERIREELKLPAHEPDVMIDRTAA